MNIVIRPIKEDEYKVLEDFLYEAIFIPEGVEKPPKDIIKNKELNVYIESFGKTDDNCLLALDNNKIIGACWTRIMNDYGHIDDNTPSLAMSILEEYRGKGIGTKLLKEMINLLKEKKYSTVSLSVQKINYAFNMYKKVGFEIADETKEEYIMVYDLSR